MPPRILLIGYGNPGRGDDGLGPALAARIEALALPGVTVEIDYQLTVDHAALIAVHDLVIFADAAIGLDAPFRLTPLVTTQPIGLGSHQVSPAAALHLAGLLFGTSPPGWVLAIAGCRFGDIREGLSLTARANLDAAAAVLAGWIGQGMQEQCQDDRSPGATGADGGTGGSSPEAVTGRR